MGGGGRLTGLHLGRRAVAPDLVPGDEPVLSAPEPLSKHAVVLGATGSGKTGLCVALLEELVLAGVPVLAIDPKGDLADLALPSPSEGAAALAPWIDPVEQERSGATPEAAAAAVVERWQRGWRESGVEADRAARLAEKLHVTVLTPGSRSGTPVDVLGALRDPGVEPGDDEALADAVRDAARSVLELIGVKADPVRDPRHVLLARLLEDAWRAGERPELHDLVVRLVDPPFERLGAFPVDTFLPRADRLDLGVRLNGLLASPSFSAWSEGVPLDPDTLLKAPPGKVAVSILYLAHLEDAERQLAAGLLLSRLAGWSRRQPGTGRLRLAVLLDEAWGFAPPHPADPPTKRPLLQLVKQARAVGVGVILGTQNPVDLDYKLLSNAGTWWIGRLATVQDKERVTDGAPREVRDWLDRLPPRTFVVREAGREVPDLLAVRHTLTWLRGPLTLREVARLTPGGSAATVAPRAPVEAPAPGAARPPESGATNRFLEPSVALGPRWREVVEPRVQAARADGVGVWEPAWLVRMRIRFDEGKDVLAEREEIRVVFPLDGAPVEPELAEGDLGSAPVARASFDGDEKALSARARKDAERRVVDAVMAGETERSWFHADTGLRSRAGEGREPFAARVRAALEARADAEIAKLAGKVEKEVERLETRRAKLERDLEGHRADAQSKLATEVVGAGETLFGLLFGRSRSLTTVASRRATTSKANARVDRTESELKELEREIYDAGAALEQEIEAVRNRHLRSADDLREDQLRLEKDDLTVTAVEVLWVPVTRAL